MHNLKDLNENYQNLEDFRKLANTTADLIFEFDPTTGEMHWSNGFTELLGYPDSEKIVGFPWWFDRVHPEDVEEVQNEFSQAMESDTNIWKIAYRLKTIDGSYHFVLNYFHIDRNKQGAPIKITGALVELDDEKIMGLIQCN